MATTDIKFPGAASFLFYPAPFKVMHGGRGGSKTWDFCRTLLLLGGNVKLFILCAREIQKSIAESVHRVLETQIDEMGIGNFYKVFHNRIVGRNGTEFVFAGIRNNITAIKSMEGIDICAVFEATHVSAHSWDILLPTIRRDAPHGPFKRGSEVWVEFNPDLATDETYKRWVLAPPEPVFRFDPKKVDDTDPTRQLRALKVRPRTIVAEVNWRDNEWFPQYLAAQKDDTQKRDYEDYLTVWEGKVRRVLKGAIYAKQLEEAQRAGRISPDIQVDRSKPVDISVDLGRADMTAIWFWQQIGMTHHAVDYYGNFGFDWSHYLEEIQNRRYIIGRIFLPHDAKHNRIEAPKSVYRQTMDAYPGEGRVIVVPVTSNKSTDINATRLLFPRICFNEKLCADGLHALAHYRYEVDPETREVSDAPLHDWASHAADALACYAMGLRDHQRKGPQMHVPAPPPAVDRHGWMAT